MGDAITFVGIDDENLNLQCLKLGLMAAQLRQLFVADGSRIAVDENENDRLLAPERSQLNGFSIVAFECHVRCRLTETHGTQTRRVVLPEVFTHLLQHVVVRTFEREVAVGPNVTVLVVGFHPLDELPMRNTENAEPSAA